MNKKYSEVIIFARPWDLNCFLQIANKLCDDFNIQSIRVISAWRDIVKDKQLIEDEITSVHDIIDLTKKANINLNQQRTKEIKLFEDYLISKSLTLNTLFSSERFLPKKPEKRIQFYYSNFEVLNLLIKENVILLSNQPDHYIYWLASELTLYKGGLFFGFSLVGRPSMWTQVLKDSNSSFETYSYTQEQLKVAKNKIQDIIRGETIGYMKKDKPNFNFLMLISSRINYIKEKAHGNYFLDYFNFLGRFHLIYERLKYNWILNKVDHKHLEDLKGRKLVYLALHMQPEASTAVYSPFFKDQFFWIESVIKSLPQNYTLVLKENPKMFGKHPKSFYSEFQKYPNLVWITPKTNSLELIKKSDLVLTITGTVAIEALAFGKKVILFGHPPFSSFFKDLRYVNNIQELVKTLSEALSGQSPSVENFEKEFANYISNLVPDSFLKKKDASGKMSIDYKESFYLFIKDTIEFERLKLPTKKVDRTIS